jgi:hypothetical protein
MKAHFWLLVSLGFVALRAVLLAWVSASWATMTEWGYVLRDSAGSFPELVVCAALCGAIALGKTVRAWWTARRTSR